MAVRYTVTTRTKSCPYCGTTLSVETENTLFTTLLVLFFLPVTIPFFLIRISLGLPKMPKIGPKVDHCPQCSSPIRTNNKSWHELDYEEVLTYQFRIWFYVSYVLGAFLGGSILCFIEGVPIISLCGLVSLISLLGIISIVVAYHIMLCNPRDTAAWVQKKQEHEFSKLCNELHQKSRKEMKNTQKQNAKVSFASTYEQRIADHKKWLANEGSGEQLIVENEVISNVSLHGIRLQRSKFVGCTFKKMDLSNSSFRRSDMSNSRFIGCNLTKTDFTGAVLNNVKFTNCNTTDTIFSGNN